METRDGQRWSWCLLQGHSLTQGLGQVSCSLVLPLLWFLLGTKWLLLTSHNQFWSTWASSGRFRQNRKCTCACFAPLLLFWWYMWYEIQPSGIDHRSEPLPPSLFSCRLTNNKCVRVFRNIQICVALCLYNGSPQVGITLGSSWVVFFVPLPFRHFPHSLPSTSPLSLCL